MSTHEDLEQENGKRIEIGHHGWTLFDIADDLGGHEEPRTADEDGSLVAPHVVVVDDADIAHYGIHADVAQADVAVAEPLSV